MKVVFFGGGSHRLIRVLRGALGEPGIFQDGEVYLYDLNVQRAEVVGKLVMKTPEYHANPCRISWGNNLAKALEGADAVAVILMAGSQKTFQQGEAASKTWGFISSDNVSPNGSLLGVKGAPIILELARKMEKICPQAWLLNFVNPIAVLSGMVNRHTRIKALGLCAGFTNHMSDLSRIFGKDEHRDDILVEAAGVNHLSFIQKGKIGGEDLFKELDRHLSKPWKMPKLQSYWSTASKEGITRSVTELIRHYRSLGVMIFSTEGDGMMHLDYEESVKYMAALPDRSGSSLAALLKARQKERQEKDQYVNSHVNRDLTEAFWKTQPPSSVFSKSEDDIFMRCLRGVSGAKKVRIVTSRINHGAIENLPSDVVCEYSQFLQGQSVEPMGKYRVQSVIHGLMSGLATHQTMLGDACATNDPRLFAHALLAYPMRPFSHAARGLFKSLITINSQEIPAALVEAKDYL